MKTKCPKCNSEKVIPIVYGLPSYDLGEKELRGEVMLGGCLVSLESPKWYCKNCGNKWR